MFNTGLQRHCMFSMEISMPDETFKRVFNLLLLHQIVIDDLHLIKLNEAESKLIFHVRLETDRMRSLKAKLNHIKRIERLECLYDHQRNQLY